MAKKQEWTVRVIVYETGNSLDLPGIWMEQFRYMSYARELANFDNPGRTVLEFYCPDKKGQDTKVWADQNAARMRSFGIDAAAAPKWLYDRDGGYTDSANQVDMDIRKRDRERSQ